MKPGWMTAILFFVLFFVTQFGLAQVLGVNFETMTDSTANVWQGLALRVGITATIFTIIALVANRAWGGGIYVQHAPPVSRWMWIIPALMVVASVARIAVNDWGSRGVEYMIALAIGVLFVGIAEETTFRGLVVRSIRGSTGNEFVVLLGSSLLFGLVHGVNILNGAAIPNTLFQIATAALGGAGFYILLRLSGSLLLPILMHALWDYGVLGKFGDAGVIDAATLVLGVVIWIVTIVAAVAIYRTSREAGQAPAGAAAS